MNQVLLLSKNLFTDHPLEFKLNKLNYEVFLSTSLLEQLQYGTAGIGILGHFQFVIIGKTVDNKELRILIDRLARYSFTFLREVEVEPDHDKQEFLTELGFHGYLNENESIEEIRERMVLAQEAQGDRKDSQLSNDSTEPIFPVRKAMENYLLPQASLSKTEKRVLNLLLEAKGKAISREELCQKLWTLGPTTSNKNQLSYLISKIKKKLPQTDFYDKTIMTIWGEGYKIMPSFYEKN